MFKDASLEEIDVIMQESRKAFLVYSKYSLKQRAAFMYAIAEELEKAGDALIQTAMSETHLPEARLRGERARTMFQLTSYADACVNGQWLDARIDTAIPDKTPPKPDIRKMLVPLGPVVVFGASNFPFAYSTAGGDTACAFAAGCSVVVKAHPAHEATSQMVAEAIWAAAKRTGMPDGLFAHVHGRGFETGEALVKHPHTAAVGFTGSTAGGKQLFDWGNQRKVPIPVFAEMGSINPVFLLPGKLGEAAAETAKQYAGSITLGVGQFCTNPGLLIGVEGEGLQTFIKTLGQEIAQVAPATMLHPGIAKAYNSKKELALSQEGVETIGKAAKEAAEFDGAALVATATGAEFLRNPVLHQEVFGPYSLVVRCKDATELQAVAEKLEGQLTATLMANDSDVATHAALIDAIKGMCGRFIMNGVPTGVEVCLSMQHGGPYPATTDSRYSAVGADGIKRFARPLSFQGWKNEWLPDELKDENPLGIWRTINNTLSNGSVSRK